VAQAFIGKHWEMIGIIPMFDPPRDDTKATIEEAKKMGTVFSNLCQLIQRVGVSTKMITGDQVHNAHLVRKRKLTRINLKLC
jgi:magnesium-transporting ATPase (P-type)